MKTPSIKPLLVVPAVDPICSRYKDLLTEVRTFPPDRGLMIDISQEDVCKTGTVSTIHELLFALQHHPDLIEQLIFNIDLRFLRPDGQPYPFEDISWIDKDHMEWLSLLGANMIFPLVFYFIQDPRKLYYALLGDMIIRQRYMGSAEHKIVANRLFNASRYLLLYCYSYNIDCDKYILRLINTCKVEFSMDELLEAHKADLGNGWPLQSKVLHDKSV